MPAEDLASDGDGTQKENDNHTAIYFKNGFLSAYVCKILPHRIITQTTDKHANEHMFDA